MYKVEYLSMLDRETLYIVCVLCDDGEWTTSLYRTLGILVL